MDFTTLITQALADGMSQDDIASAFTDAMNKVDTANKSKKERDKFVDIVRVAVNGAVQREEWDPFRAAQILTLNAAQKYPEWTVEDLKNYEESMVIALEDSAQAYDTLAKQTPQELQKLFDVIESIFSRDDKSRIKDADDTIIKRFLSHFDLPG